MDKEKRFLALFTGSILILGFFASVSQTVLADVSEDMEPPFVPGQVIISFKPGVTPEEIEDFYEDFYDEYEIEEEEDLDSDDEDEDPEEKLTTVSVEVTKELIEILRSDPRVEYVEHNYILTIDLTPNELQFDQLWGLHNTGQTGGTPDADIDSPEAWDTTTGSPSIIVGVIDTGINYNHEDLASNTWTNPGEIPNNGIDDDGNGYIDDIHGINAITNSGDPMDDNRHGTHVSGTIGAQGNNGKGVVGVNWNVSIAACKFLNSGGSGTTANAVKCFKYFNKLKNEQGYNVVVTSNSWGGGGFSQALQDAMAGLDQPGMSPILHITAAGNSNSDTDSSPHYPSSYNLDNIISVAATDHNDLYASFSNYGASSVDLAAPGVNILSTSIPGNNYESLSGTSVATPHVAGAAAIIWSFSPNLTASQVKQHILSGIDNIAGFGSNALKPTLTNGRLNVLNALPQEIDPTPPSAVTDLAVSGSGLTSVTLTWTATGDDGLTGTASSYDVRYSNTLITSANWATASQAVGEPSPQVSGSTETFTVSGLSPSTSYYFALKVRDNVGNESNLSNVVTGSTLVTGTIVFDDNMESGPSLWTTAGNPGLWHLSTHRSNSPNTSYYYGIDGVWNYDTGASNSGTLTSTAINLAGSTDALLTFNEWSQVESFTSFDRTRVQVSTDGVSWVTVFESHGTNNAWVKETVDLTPYVGGNINLRFWFDTIDPIANTFEGWYVDDVQVVVTPSGAPPPANNPPVADNQSVTTPEDTPVIITLTGSDIDGDALTFSIVNGPTDGTLSTITPLGPSSAQVTYTPFTNFNLADSFTFTVSDGLATSNLATVSITVKPVNDPPVANDDTATTTENTAVTINVLSNDIDVDGDTLTVSSATSPTNGLVVINPDNTITYTPNTSFNGVDTFTYTISDPLLAVATATVTVTVNAVSVSPVAVDAVSSASSNGTPIFSWSHITGSGTDRLLVVSTSVGDNPATITGITYGGIALTKLRSDVNTGDDTATELWYLINPANGINTITVTMSEGGSAVGGAVSFTGVDQITPFSSNTGATGTGTLASVVVTSATDEMVVSVLAIFEGDSSATPVSGQNERWDLIDDAVEGAGSTTTGATSVTMSWTKDDNDWAIGVASIKAAAAGPPPSPNTPPVLSVPALPINISELVPFGFKATATDPDVPAQTLTFSLVNEPLGALIDAVSGDFTWTPTEAQGPATYTFDVKVTDSGSPPLSDSKSVTVMVDEVNVVPIANSQSVTTNEDTSVAITLSGTDADIPVQVLTFSLVNSPTNGVLSGIAPSLTYTPNTNFNSFDSFAFTISDGIATSNIATVIITITAVNDAPVAVNDSYTTNEDTPLTIIATGVLGNDTDTENDPLTAVLDTTTSNGSLTLNSDGSFTYTPDPDFNGSDSFTYHANDGTDNSNIATVTITVDPVNDAPVADAQSVTTTENTSVAITLTGSDVDGDALTFSIVTGPSPGTLSGLNPSAGTVTYTPATNFNGADSFTFQVNDGLVNGNIATVSVTITPIPINNPPIANAGADQTVTSGALVTLDGSGSDPDGDPITFSWSQTSGPAVTLSDPTLAKPTFNAPSVTIPTTLSFNLVVNDGKVNSVPDSVIITVNPLITPPSALSVNITPIGTIPLDDTFDVEATISNTGSMTLSGVKATIIFPPNLTAIDPTTTTIGDIPAGGSVNISWELESGVNPGSFTITVKVVDSSGASAQDSINLDIQAEGTD